MAVEGARRRELAKLVSNHFLGDAHRDVLLPVVDAESQSDELRQDSRTPAPHLDDFVPAGRTRCIRLLQQIAINERAFPNGTRHVLVLFLLLPRVAAGDDELTSDFILAGLLALR